MFVRNGGRWVLGVNTVKVRGLWKPVTRMLIKTNGRWADLVTVIQATLWQSGIVVGGNLFKSIYGYRNTYTSFGSASKPRLLAGNTVESFVTGGDPYLGTGPYQWVELCVIGKVSDMSLRPIYLNGIKGENVNNYLRGNRTYFQWVFPYPIPIQGSWTVVA